jgi:hypothetical protein
MPSATNIITPSSKIGSPSLDIIPKKLLEQFGQVKQQATSSAQQMSQAASLRVGQARGLIVESISNAADTLRDYVKRYPPLAAFLFAFMALSAIPVGIFTLFSVVTCLIFLSIALVGFGIVEGFFLVTGGTVLLAVLGVIAFITAVGFAWGAAAYATYKGGSSLLSRFSKSAGGLSQRTQETFRRIQQQQFGSSTLAPASSSPLRS